MDMKLIDGEAVLVWRSDSDTPTLGKWHAAHGTVTILDGWIGYAPKPGNVVPLRLARVAGEMAEALVNIAKNHASGKYSCSVCEGAGGRWPCETRAEAVAVLAKAGIEVPNE